MEEIRVVDRVESGPVDGEESRSGDGEGSGETHFGEESDDFRSSEREAGAGVDVRGSRDEWSRSEVGS